MKNIGMKLGRWPMISGRNVVFFQFILIMIGGFFVASADARFILAPIGVTLLIATFFWQTLSGRRKEAPLADPGVLTVLAIVCYTIIPPLQFILSGMKHTILSAHQLYILDPTPEQLTSFTWWYVIYLLSFIVGYLAFDSKERINLNSNVILDRSTVVSFVVIFFILSFFMFGIEELYGINLYSVYDAEILSDSQETLLNMPLLFRQFYGIISHIGIILIVKVGLLLTIFLNWERPSFRYAFFIWVILMLVSNVLWMGARTDLVLMCLASVVMYHRFVKNLRLKYIIPAVVISFCVFIIIGLMRGQATLNDNLEQARFFFDNPEPLISTSNEFQALFGGNYDVYSMRQAGLLGDVPPQFKLYDFIMIIPQQILPFEKLDVQQWVGSRSNNPSYFMFNPISQSIIGFGWVELILRGLFLGFILARLRTWYIRRSSSFWATLLYFYILTISYYTIRSTAVYILLVSVLFRFIPLYLFVRFLVLRNSVQAPKHNSVSPKIGDA